MDAIAGISACRSLRSCLNFPLGRFFGTLAEMISAFDTAKGSQWYVFANSICQSEFAQQKLLNYLLQGEKKTFYSDLAEKLSENYPLAIYPTS